MFRNLIQTTQYKKERLLTYRTKKSSTTADSRDLNLSFSSSLFSLSLRFTLRQAFSKAPSSFRSNSCQLRYSSTQLPFFLIIPEIPLGGVHCPSLCHMHDLKTAPMAKGCGALKRAPPKITQVLLTKEQKWMLRLVNKRHPQQHSKRKK